MTARKYLAWGAALLVLAAAISALGWHTLPADARIAIHYGFDGAADRWADPKTAALVIPPAMLLIYLVGLLDIRNRIRRGEARPWTAPVVLAALALLTAMNAWMLGSPAAEGRGVAPLIGVGTGVVFIIAGFAARRPGARSQKSGARAGATLRIDVARWAARESAGRGFLALGAVLVLTGALLPLAALFAVVMVGLATTGVVAARRGHPAPVTGGRS